MTHLERFFIYITPGTNASLTWVLKQRHHSNLILMNFNKRKNKAKGSGKINQNAVFLPKRWGIWYTALRQNLPLSCSDQFYSNTTKYLSLEMPKMALAVKTDAVMTLQSRREIQEQFISSSTPSYVYSSKVNWQAS